MLSLFGDLPLHAYCCWVLVCGMFGYLYSRMAAVFFWFTVCINIFQWRMKSTITCPISCWWNIRGWGILH